MTEPTQARPARRRYSQAYKEQLVEAYRQSGVSVAAFARDTDVHATVLRRWITRRPRARQAPIVGAEPAFVPVCVGLEQAAETLRITLQGRGLSAELNWPIHGAAQCAQWLRTVLE